MGWFSAWKHRDVGVYMRLIVNATERKLGLRFVSSRQEIPGDLIFKGLKFAY